MMDRCMTGAVLIAVIALFRLIGARRLPKRIFCVLWVFAALYLLLPVRIPSPVNFYSLLLRSREPLPATDVTVMVVSSAQAPQPRAVDPWTVVRLAVSGLLGLWMLAIYVAGLLRLYRGTPVSHSYLRTWSLQHPLRRPLRILSSEKTAVPISGGILFPVILLPADRDRCTDRELECILTHEFFHICHLDALWKLVLSACLCVWWFHPAVWLMVILACRDMEYACDEAVLESGISGREYGAALIRMELRRAERLALSNSFVAGRLLKRVDRIGRHRDHRTWGWISGAALALLILSLFATVPARARTQAASADASVSASLQAAMEEIGSQPREKSGVGVPETAASLHVSIGTNIAPAVQSTGVAWEPYDTFRLLGTLEGVSEAQLDDAMDELADQYHPYVLRITDEGATYTVRVYDFPEGH